MVLGVNPHSIPGSLFVVSAVVSAALSPLQIYGSDVVSFDEHLSKNAIEVHVSRLRTKIEPAGVHIRTVRGFGYLWDGLNE